MVNYKSKVLELNIEGSVIQDPQTDNPTDNPTVSPNIPVGPGAISGQIYHSFTASGLVSDYFTFTGNLSDSKGTLNYNGDELKICLKMESATEIKFTLDTKMTLTLVFDNQSKKVKIDGKTFTTDSSGLLEIELDAGEHIINKGDSINLFYISLS